jgi:hypothetical protein
MPNEVETIDAGDLYEFVDEVTPAAADWNQNPELFRSKLNELIVIANRAQNAIRVIGADATVRGKVYRISGTNLVLLQPNLADLNKYSFGIGTGVAGEIQGAGVMDTLTLTFSSYPCRIFLGAGGVLIEEKNLNEADGYWAVPLGVAESATQIVIEINRDALMKFSAAGNF